MKNKQNHRFMFEEQREGEKNVTRTAIVIRTRGISQYCQNVRFYLRNPDSGYSQKEIKNSIKQKKTFRN